MKNKPRIIVEIQGGLCFNLVTNQETDVFLIDWDNLAAESEKEHLKLTLAMCEAGDGPDQVVSNPEFDAYLNKVKAEIGKLIDKLFQKEEARKEKKCRT